MKIRLYDLPTIREPEFVGWARITLTEDGLFTAASDYGDYSYWWTSTGEKDFRNFVLRLNDSYMIDKFQYGRPRPYDRKATLKSIRQTILEYRRCGDFYKDQARLFWDELAEYSHLDTEDDFNQWYRDSAFAKQFVDAHEHFTRGDSAQVVAFVQKIIPRLKEKLREELEAESTMIQDWEKLEVGKFYKLSCGCEGQVIRVDTGPGDPSDRGFYMAYSIMGCRDQSTHEKAYREGYGPYCNYFNYGLNTGAMPAKEIEKPSWWEEVVGERIKRITDRWQPTDSASTV